MVKSNLKFAEFCNICTIYIDSIRNLSELSYIKFSNSEKMQSLKKNHFLLSVNIKISF